MICYVRFGVLCCDNALCGSLERQYVPAQRIFGGARRGPFASSGVVYGSFVGSGDVICNKFTRVFGCSLSHRLLCGVSRVGDDPSRVGRA